MQTYGEIVDATSEDTKSTSWNIRPEKLITDSRADLYHTPLLHRRLHQSTFQGTIVTVVAESYLEMDSTPAAAGAAAGALSGAVTSHAVRLIHFGDETRTMSAIPCCVSVSDLCTRESLWACRIRVLRPTGPRCLGPGTFLRMERRCTQAGVLLLERQKQHRKRRNESLVSRKTASPRGTAKPGIIATCWPFGADCIQCVRN